MTNTEVIPRLFAHFSSKKKEKKNWKMKFDTKSDFYFDKIFLK